MTTVLYCASFLVLWRLSQDQWYLPAGLRVAALLMLPPRLWPFALLGDAAAVFGLRWRIVDQYNPAWAIVPALLLPPLLAVAPILMRRLLTPWHAHVRWIPLALAAIALWVAVWMLTFDQLLAGPQGAASLTKFLRFAIGYYLGMLMVVPLAMLWIRRNDGEHQPSALWRDAAVATGVIASLGLAVTVSTLEPSLKQFLLILMIAPPTALALLHGWRGAALGVVSANVAIALSLPAANVLGAHDETTFAAHQVLAAAATILFVFGAIVSGHFDRARRLGVSEAQALQIARASFLSTDRNLRERVMLLAQMQARLVDSKADLVRRLKAHGKFSAAMDVLRDAALHDELFEAHTSALYPLSIETHGLYDAVQSPSFSAVWAQQRRVRFGLRGQPKTLTVDLQIAAYRCVCHAIALLSAGDPSAYRIRARVWAVGARRGIAVVVESADGVAGQRTAASTMAELELEGRLQMHSGALRRRRDDRVSFVLSEPDCVPEAAYCPSAGTIDQVSPAAP